MKLATRDCVSLIATNVRYLRRRYRRDRMPEVVQETINAQIDRIKALRAAQRKLLRDRAVDGYPAGSADHQPSRV